jgi:hypothetical protein
MSKIKIKKSTTKKDEMTSTIFLEKAFSTNAPVTDNKNIQIINELNTNFFKDYYCKSPDKGGKSGAKVYLLFEKNDNGEPNYNELKYVFKYNDGALKNMNNLTHSKPLNKQDYYMYKNKYNSEQTYIRAIRENYLSKKFTEIQEKQITPFITPKAIKIGFLKDFTLIEKNNTLIINPTDKQKENSNTIREKLDTQSKIYIPFILQEGSKGKELEKYVFKKKNNKQKILTDELCYNILYQLGVALMKFNELIKSSNNANKFIGCHRDMHPGNIFVIQEDEQKSDVSIMFIDFDLSITNKKELTSDNKCTRKTLSWNKNLALKQYIETTATYTKRTIKGTLQDYFLISHNLFKKDTDLYQYMSYYKFYYDNIESNTIKYFLKDSLKKAIEVINNNPNNKNLKHKFLESLTKNLSPPTQQP